MRRMNTRFRALRWVSALYKIVAWLFLIAGVLFAGLLAVLGAVQESVGAPSPVLANVPVLNLASNLPGGIFTGLGVLFVALIQFLLLLWGQRGHPRGALHRAKFARGRALSAWGELAAPSAATRLLEPHTRGRARKKLAACLPPMARRWRACCSCAACR